MKSALLTVLTCSVAIALAVGGHFAAHADSFHPEPADTRETVLVGTGCGPFGETLVAREEDEFPLTCERIDAHWLAPQSAGGR